MSTEVSESEQAPAPTVQIVAGNPTADEVAAVIAVVLAAASGTADEPKQRPSLWGTPVLRRPVQAGPGAWQHSARA